MNFEIIIGSIVIIEINFIVKVIVIKTIIGYYFAEKDFIMAIDYYFNFLSVDYMIFRIELREYHNFRVICLYCSMDSLYIGY